jgi:hypothetical protein
VFGKSLSIRSRVGTGGGPQSREIEALMAEDPLTAFAVNDLGGKVKQVKNNEEKSS